MGELVLSGVRLQVTYMDVNSQRWVTPVQVLGLSDYIYLKAYCHLRHAERNFRLDRIL